MKKIGLLLIIIYLFIINVNAETALQKVTFNRCVDGDTAMFNVDGESVKYRFLAIDTPETVKPNTEVQEYGKDASEYTCNKLTNAKEIIIEYEKSSKTDKYGRSLGWIWVDGSLLQKELVEVGYAKVAYIYGKYRYTTSLCLVQKEAKETKQGVWSNNDDDGYCSTVDLTNVENNIIYDNLPFENNTSLEKEEDDNNKEEEEQLTGALAKLDKVQNKVNDYLDNHEDKVERLMYYAILASGIIYLIIKEVRK